MVKSDVGVSNYLKGLLKIRIIAMNNRKRADIIKKSRRASTYFCELAVKKLHRLGIIIFINYGY
ncbi:MAG: hypothetical protein QXD13_01545 [Candidatus Pacearchaeota archaeon]